MEGISLETLEIPKERCLIVFKSAGGISEGYNLIDALAKMGFAQGSMIVFLLPHDELTLLTDEQLAEGGLRRIEE